MVQTTELKVLAGRKVNDRKAVEKEKEKESAIMPRRDALTVDSWITGRESVISPSIRRAQRS